MEGKTLWLAMPHEEDVDIRQSERHSGALEVREKIKKKPEADDLKEAASILGLSEIPPKLCYASMPASSAPRTKWPVSGTEEAPDSTEKQAMPDSKKRPGKFGVSGEVLNICDLWHDCCS